MSQRAAAGGEGKLGGDPQRKRVRKGRAVAGRAARSRASYPGAGRSGGETPWRPEPTGVEKPGDDPGVGVKGLSSPEISRSPRNGFRAGLVRSPAAVEPPDPLGGLAAYRREPNSERRRATSTGVRTRGLSRAPERGTAQTARQGPQVAAEWQRMSGRADSQDVGPEAATRPRSA